MSNRDDSAAPKLTQFAAVPRTGRTLAGRYYADPAIFDAELRTIFASSWINIGRFDRLASPGDYFVVALGRESVIVVRGRDGQPRAFFNTCPHRGTQLCDPDSHGNARSFQCPYHAWSFNTCGELVAAPMLADLEATGWQRAQGNLRQVHLEAHLGSLWLSFSDDPPALASHLRAVIAGRFEQPATFDRYGIDRLVIGAVREYEVAANWKLMIENFLECTHCAPLHTDFIRLIPSYRSGRANLHGGDGGVELGPGIDGFTWTGRASRPPLPTLRREDHRRFHSFTIFPNVMVVLMPDQVMLFDIFPLAHDRTRVRVEWLFDRAVIEQDPGSLEDTVPLFDKINREDWVLLERTQRGVASRGFARGGVLAPTEIQITAFHDYVLANLEHVIG